MTIKVLQGKLTRDVEVFGKQDPYIKLEYLGQRHKTKIHESGGLEPVWGDVFNLNLGSISDELHFECKDDEVVGVRPIGDAIIKASALCINGGVREWFSLHYEGGDVGKILLETHFVPNV